VASFNSRLSYPEGRGDTWAFLNSLRVPLLGLLDLMRRQVQPFYIQYLHIESIPFSAVGWDDTWLGSSCNLQRA
jgi:hypothetical protein